MLATHYTMLLRQLQKGQLLYNLFWEISWQGKEGECEEVMILIYSHTKTLNFMVQMHITTGMF